MANREENLKKINAELKKLSDDELEQVAGGSLQVTEENAKKAGLTLKKEDGSPGSFGVFWNTGDYYWRGQKISNQEAWDIDFFTRRKGYQPDSIKEAEKFRGDRVF